MRHAWYSLLCSLCIFCLLLLLLVVALWLLFQKSMKVLVSIKVQDYFITLFVCCSRLNANH